ncbi:KINESIN-LIKE PROTEIN KLP-3 [Salix purpurea]|uniref:KINESIN-LIKE PROTEIN KLP-3 n=1 Tax=Salix purpurea TaxID=77065 RepID=A0A9Q1A6K9_SALPP|nr:KINESIN-LIKE PROTEIN KLP-3 [Salix purpurea]
MLSFPPISFHKVCYSNGEYTLMLSNILFPLDLHTLRIISAFQPNGLAVPDASMHPVTSTSDVLELIGVELKNRVVGATAMNERSSRSHSVVSIHVRGKDLLSGAALHGNFHLVDLAGSERVDRSEATRDRLKEAQHINRSLSALGDVIFSLAQKNSHVPYKNSKLTQLLQSSLGGQAKTLMFVQLNPDVSSYSETISTLKFAERVSGVELGAARSSKGGRDFRELMDQVCFCCYKQYLPSSDQISGWNSMNSVINHHILRIS